MKSTWTWLPQRVLFFRRWQTLLRILRNPSSQATTFTIMRSYSINTRGTHRPSPQMKETPNVWRIIYILLLSTIYLSIIEWLPSNPVQYILHELQNLPGVFRYISPADLERPMNMSSNFRLYWPAWKDVRRGTLRLHCKFVEVKRDERSSRPF